MEDCLQWLRRNNWMQRISSKIRSLDKIKYILKAQCITEENVEKSETNTSQSFQSRGPTETRRSRQRQGEKQDDKIFVLHSVL